MHWDDLRVFLAVARAGRVSTAARRLRVKHTTVSRRLSAIEGDLGVALFYRTASGYLLTPHGKNILADAEAIERTATAIDARVRERSGQLVGRVRIALLEEFASHWLAPKLPAFRALHPAIDLEIKVGIQQLDLSRGEAELAVRTPRPSQVGLAATRLARTTTGLYLAKTSLGGKRLRIETSAGVRNLPLLVYSSEHHALQHAAWFQPVLAAGRAVLVTNSTYSLVEGARAGVGVAVLPRFIARDYDDLVAVSADVAAHDVWLATHPEFRRDPTVRAVAQFLKQSASGPAGIDV